MVYGEFITAGDNLVSLVPELLSPLCQSQSGSFRIERCMCECRGRKGEKGRKELAVGGSAASRPLCRFIFPP